MPLGSNDLKFHGAQVGAAIVAFETQLASLGLRARLSADFSVLKRLYPNFAKRNSYHRGFDPDWNPALAGHWLYGTDAAGDVKFSVAAKRVSSEDFCDEIASRRLWYADPPQDAAGAESEEIELRFDRDNLTHLKGELAVGGMLWLHPDVRGKGLSRGIHLAMQSIMLGLYDFDFYVAVIDTALIANGLATREYGFRNLHYGTKFRRNEHEREYWIAYNSRKDAMSDHAHGLSL